MSIRLEDSGGGIHMKDLIPENVISQIFKLNLSTRLIADNKARIPIIVKERIGEHTYKVIIDVDKSSLDVYKKFVIELRGKVDIEFLKYQGEVKLTPIPNVDGYYKMKILNFYKSDERRYRRVPYRRAIKIVEPIVCDGVLINISASGAFLQSKERIEGDFLTMEFTLLKKQVSLTADIVEEKYNEELNVYEIRCDFDSIDQRSQKIIMKTVKEITLMAKRRLQG